MNYGKSILGSSIAFMIATSCCWFPAFIIMVGGGSTFYGLNSQIEKLSGIFIAIGLGLLGLGLYQYYQKKKKMRNNAALLKSTITCPNCGHQKEEIMPISACQYFYECENCKKMLKPKQGDCCVFCSYATFACPSIQSNQGCC